MGGRLPSDTPKRVEVGVLMDINKKSSQGDHGGGLIESQYLRGGSKRIRSSRACLAK